MDADTRENIAQEAQAILEKVGDPSLPGLEADTKVTFNNTIINTNQELVLGQRVEARIIGYVEEAGDKLIENEGKRHQVKVKTTLIEIIE